MNKYLPIFFLSLFIITGCQSTPPPIDKNQPSPTTSQSSSESGGYYLDDGPDNNPPKNLDATPSATPKIEPIIKRASRPYKAFKKKYTPMKKIQPYKVKGYASWYGKRYHGNQTSIGEIYDMYQMTAAHKTLPLPCYVRVTNLNNNLSIIVRVNDRGPFVKNRIIDLSYVAAHKLKIIDKGSEFVEIELIDPSHQILTIKKQNFYIQAGAFSSKKNAEKMIKKLNEINSNNEIKIQKITKHSLYQVLIGPYVNREQAENFSNKFSKKIKINSFITTN